jgi:hypothetical protein
MEKNLKKTKSKKNLTKKKIQRFFFDFFQFFFLLSKSAPISNLITPRHIFIIIFISKIPFRAQKCQFLKS